MARHSGGTALQERPGLLAGPRPLPGVEEVPLAPGRVARSVRPLVRFVQRKPLGALGALLFLLLALGAVAAPWVAPYDPAQTGVGVSFQAPSWRHWMGLDQLGRDLFSRVLYGGRLSLWVAVASTVVSTLVGTALGLVSAQQGGKVDLLLQRVVDGMIVFPALVLALLLIAVLGPSTTNVIVAITFVFAPRMSRVIRSAALVVKAQPYIEAARAVGAGDLRIMTRHILPNIFGPIMVLATLNLGTAIVIEASLSYLGITASATVPSWGRMLSGASTDYLRESPHLSIFPGLAISLAVLAVNFLGDALRDVWDPRLREGR